MKLANRVIILIVALLFSLTPDVSAKDVKSVRSQRETAKKQLSSANKKLRENEEQVKSRLNQLNLVEAEIARHEEDIAKAQNMYNVYSAQAQKLNDSIEEANRQLNKIKDAYGAAVRHVQKNGKDVDQLMFVFAAEDFHQALQRYRYLKQFSKWREEQSQIIADKQKTIRLKQQRLDSAATKANKAMEYLNLSLKQVEEKRNEQTQVIAKLQKDGNTLKSVISSQEKKLRELDAELEKLIKQEEQRAKEAARKAAAKKADEQAQKAKAEVTKTTPTTPAESHKPTTAEKPVEEIKKLSGSFEQNKGKLPMPVTGKGIIVKHFGRQRHDQLKNVETNNGGIDIETSSDSRARAIFDGKVSGVFQTADFNNVVMIRHGEYLTIYVNIAGVNVKSGQEVKSGDIIGTIFSDPNDDNRTVLHFEIRHEVEKLNPELWLKP